MRIQKLGLCMFVWLGLLLCLRGFPVRAAPNDLERKLHNYFGETVEQDNFFANEDAFDTAPNQQIDQQQYFNDSGANDLYQLLPDTTKGMLQQLGLDTLNSDTLVHLRFSDLMTLIGSYLLESVKKPFMILSVTLGMVLLASMMGLLRTTTEGSTESLFTVVAVLCMAGVILTPIVQMVQKMVSLIQEVNQFMIGFIPVYAGIIAVSGKPISAFTYNTMLISSTQIISYLLTSILIPFIGIYLALTVMGSVNSSLSIGAVTKTLRSIVIWCLGLFFTVFVALLTIRSFVAGAADTVAFRTGRFFISSLIPVVGGAVGESLSVVQGSLGLIRSTVGAFGIVVLLLMFLSAIIELLLMSFVIKITHATSELMQVETVAKLLDAIDFVLSILLAVVIFFCLMLIVSVSLMLVLGATS